MYSELLEIPQIGPQIASSIVEYFAKITNINLLKELISLKLENSYEDLNALFSGNITNKNFVITGKLTKFSSFFADTSTKMSLASWIFYSFPKFRMFWNAMMTCYP